MPLLLIVATVASRGLWMPAVGWSLVCAEEIVPGDAILVENFDPEYPLFERAAALQRAGLAARVLVPTPAAGPGSGAANPVSRGIAELMARFAGVQDLQIVPIDETEPYSLTTAYQVRDVLTRERLRSILLVAPALRSRRSWLVYRAVLAPAGVRVACLPVVGPHTPDNWARSWHGIQAVSMQFVKLQVYRFYVLRVHADISSGGFSQ